MQRIMIIGSCGAGKSTLARRLQAITPLPIFHLDQHYWSAGWTQKPKTEWENTVEQLSAQPQWIIDGNYSGTMDIRLAKADCVIFLDYPTWKCLYRIIRRIIRFHGKVRPDMVEGCPERFDWNFIHYVMLFRLTRRDSLIEKLKKAKKNVQVFIIKNDRSVDQFLQNIKTQNLAL